MASDIYREIILDHNRYPRNKGTLDPNDYSAEDVNPLCGDEIRIDLRIKEGKVDEGRFSARAGAVSQPSASILTEMVEGKTLDEVKALTKDHLLEEIGIPVSPARLK